MNVVTTFLNGHLDEEIYMEIPDGFPGAGDPTVKEIISYPFS